MVASERIRKVADGVDGVSWDLDVSRSDPHPSAGVTDPNATKTVERSWNSGSEGGTAVATVGIPVDLAAASVEIAFQPSAVRVLPSRIDVFDSASPDGGRLNRGRSGDWIHSLAADALVRRRPVVATVMLNEPARREIRIRFVGSDNPPIAHILLHGRAAE